MKKITSASLLIIGFLVGATALSAIAGTWTAPGTGCTPPNCNVDAPVTTGGGVTGNVYSQTKSGLLGLTDTIIKNLQVLTGEGTTTSTAGKVLTALDNEGTVGWRSGGTGSLTFSTEQTVESTTASLVTIDLGSTTTYGGCFITNINITENNEWQGGRCQITQSSGTWKLTAQGNGRPNDITQCSARCIGQ